MPSQEQWTHFSTLKLYVTKCHNKVALGWPWSVVNSVNLAILHIVSHNSGEVL